MSEGNSVWPLTSDGKVDLERCSDEQINYLRAKAIERLLNKKEST